MGELVYMDVEEVEGESIVYMTDPEAHFVSLVKRGANRTPFLVVKAHKEGREVMEEGRRKVLQAIVAPADLEVDAIKAAFDEDVLDALVFDKVRRRGSTVVYEQFAREAIKADSFELVAVDKEKGIYGLCAEPVVKEQSLVERVFRRKRDAAKAVVVDVDEVKPQTPEEALDYYRMELWNELEALVSVLSGAALQKGATVEGVLSTMRQSLDNFYRFAEEMLVVTGGTVPEMEVKLMKKEELDQKVETNIQEEVVKTEEEQPVVNEEATVKEDGEGEASRSDELRELFAKIDSMIAELSRELDAVKADVAGIKKSVPAVVVKRDSDSADTGVVKEEKGARREGSVFSGVLFKL